MLGKLPLAAVAALLLISGCVSSENALCLPDDDKAVFDPALLGDWLGEITINARGSLGFANGSLQVGPPTITQSPPPQPGRPGQVIRFDRIKEGSKAYMITERSTAAAQPAASTGKPCVATLLAIGDVRFLDVSLVAPQTKQEQRHQFFKVEVAQDKLTVNLMDPSYFSAHPDALAHFQEAEAGWFNSSTKVITAPTPTIRAFFEQHRNDPELWPKGWTVELHRP